MMNPLAIDTLLTDLETDLKQKVSQRGLNNPLMIGIRTGGIWIAEHLHRQLAISEPLGLLDITFYRDDFSQMGVHPNVKPSQLPPHIEGRDIILVDDVFYTGRTIRAALNEIFDFGRPKQVLLAALIQRNGKQIPIQPDCYGTCINLDANQRLKISGPDPLAIHIETSSPAP